MTIEHWPRIEAMTAGPDTNQLRRRSVASDPFNGRSVDSVLNPPAFVQTAERSLGEIAAVIKEEFALAERCTREGLGHYRKVGELLLNAKGRVPHGGWLDWVGDNVPFGDRQARKYMRLAQEWEKVSEANRNSDSDLNLDSAMKLLSSEPPDEQQTLPMMNRLYCRPCRVSGQPKPGCKDCEAMNAQAAPALTAEPPGQEQPARTQELQPAAPRPNRHDQPPKPPKSVNRHVEEVAKVIRRVMNRIATAYGIKYHDAVLNTSPRTYDNPLLQRVNEQWFKFKSVLEDAERILAMHRKKTR
jgi:hypothetical protein